MRKLDLSILLAAAVLVLGTFSLPASADPGPGASADDGFLRQLATENGACPQLASTADLPNMEPEPQPASGCSAELTCWGGNMISCTGNTSCTVNCGSVTCDGSTVPCTCTLPPPYDCPGHEVDYCSCRTCGFTHHYCFFQWCQ